MAVISVVIPVLNEESCLEALFERLSKLGEDSSDDYEYIFVDDGSTDASQDMIRKLAAEHGQVKYLFFSRNFGHEAATTAGLDHTRGDAVVIIDADLQDPPEVIPALIAKWREGNQVVYAQRRSRKGEPWRKKLTSWLFYRTIRKLTDVDIPIDTGDFRLMDRCVVEQVRRCREKSRFVRGLVTWTGYKQVPMRYGKTGIVLLRPRTVKRPNAGDDGRCHHQQECNNHKPVAPDSCYIRPLDNYRSYSE